MCVGKIRIMKSSRHHNSHITTRTQTPEDSIGLEGSIGKDRIGLHYLTFKPEGMTAVAGRMMAVIYINKTVVSDFRKFILRAFISPHEIISSLWKSRTMPNLIND